MALRSYPNVLVLPPPDRPCWKVRSGFDLHYLGWGKRFYGASPIPITRHTGWPYLVILRGTPTLTLADGALRLKPGDIFLMHPDCPSGWTDRGRVESEILSWIWQTAPDAAIAPLAGEFLTGYCDADHLERLKRLHTECRREVALSDRWSPQAITAFRFQIDALFGRAIHGKGQKSHATLQFELASRWIRENLSTRNAISCLCEYLDVSSSHLYQLFIKRAGCSPAAYFHNLRMEHARDLITHRGLSAKETAHILGYRHANDFCRAFKQAFKTGTRSCGKSRIAQPST